MKNNQTINTKNFCLKAFDISNQQHQDIKNILESSKEANQISSNIENFITNNLLRNKIDGISNVYIIYYDNSPIGILFTNHHPEEEQEGKLLPAEIEICLGIIPHYQNKHLGQFLENEISKKLLEIYPSIPFIVADISPDNIKSKKAALKAGFTYFEGNQYHYNRKEKTK